MFDEIFKKFVCSLDNQSNLSKIAFIKRSGTLGIRLWQFTSAAKKIGFRYYRFSDISSLKPLIISLLSLLIVIVADDKLFLNSIEKLKFIYILYN